MGCVMRQCLVVHASKIAPIEDVNSLNIFVSAAHGDANVPPTPKPSHTFLRPGGTSQLRDKRIPKPLSERRGRQRGQ